MLPIIIQQVPTDVSSSFKGDGGNGMLYLYRSLFRPSNGVFFELDFIPQRWIRLLVSFPSTTFHPLLNVRSSTPHALIYFPITFVHFRSLPISDFPPLIFHPSSHEYLVVISSLDLRSTTFSIYSLSRFLGYSQTPSYRLISNFIHPSDKSSY